MEEDLEFFINLLQEHNKFLDGMYQQYGAFQRGNKDELEPPFKPLLDQHDRDDLITAEQHERFINSVSPHHVAFLGKMLQRHHDKLESLELLPQDKQKSLQQFDSFTSTIIQQYQDSVDQMIMDLFKQVLWHHYGDIAMKYNDNMCSIEIFVWDKMSTCDYLLSSFLQAMHNIQC